MSSHDKSGKASSSSKKSSGNSGGSRSSRGQNIPSSGQSSGRHSSRHDNFWSVVLEKDGGTPLSPPTVVTPGARNADGGKAPRPHSERQFSCELCKNGFERRGHLEAHIETVHEGKRPHHCPYGCGKSFGHRSSLSRHIKSAHDSQKLPPLSNPKRKQSSSKYAEQ